MTRVFCHYELPHHIQKEQNFFECYDESLNGYPDIIITPIGQFFFIDPVEGLIFDEFEGELHIVPTVRNLQMVQLTLVFQAGQVKEVREL